ncbi:MAG: hypothetical protein GEV05_27310 [Betaproteobacteria bacterium]|nr:hypothetical protein [Betaproteobacteria bacterium]
MDCRLKTTLVGISFALAATLAAAQSRQPPADPAVASSEWAKGNRVLLGVTQERLGFSAQWRFQRSGNGDIVLDLEETRAGQARAGALMLVANGVLLARDVPLERGRELDSFNGPLLMLQLVLRLLERAVPAGPASIKREMPIDAAEHDRAVKVSTIGADGEFLAPWRVTGQIGPGADGQVRFELQFVSANRSPRGAPYETRIVGIWQNASPPVQLPDTMPLRGWRGFRIKTVVTARGAMNAVGLGTSAAMAFANIGEVRRRVADWTDQGARRARWQCG